jgi:ABC-type phosphate transport system permease subunit
MEGTMATRAKAPLLDRIAMGLSGLCLVHCLATAVLLGFLATAGGFLGQPIIHEVGLALAMVLGSIALARGWNEHRSVLPFIVGSAGIALMALAVALPEGGRETILTVAGVSVLALGHRLNILARN